MRYLFLALALAFAPLSVLAQSKPDPTVTFDARDPQMSAAIAAARQSLPLFLSNTVNDEGYGPDGGYLKVAFRVKDPDVDHENIWVGPFLALDEENFVALLANEPRWMPGQHAGDQVRFTYDMIVDWNLDRGDGRYYGDYTTRVVATRLSEDEAAALRERFIDPPVPADWEE